MMRSPRLTFNKVILIVGALVSIAVATGPLLREVWARYTWQRVPAYNFPDTDKFLFLHKGKTWICARPNLWHSARTDAMVAASQDLPGPPNTVCYVSTGHPPIAVLRLDAYQHLDLGAGNFAAAAALFAVTVGLVIFSSRKKRVPVEALQP